ncbi:hypothetical protein B0G83_101248 [Paraburkholderia sp. BL21I4N1]|nr:hypothetical protein B0G83_101248 [Paraburkholderia sp. BL21I4N1]
MTTLSSLNALPALAVTPLSNASASVASVSATASQESVTAAASTIVTIPSMIGVDAPVVYTPEGKLANVAPTVTWARSSTDAVTMAMAGNYMSQSISGQFSGLGSALLDRFKTTGNDFSQSVNVASTGGVSGLEQSAQSPQGDIKLTVKTASGVEVDIALDSSGGTLSVSMHSSGKLSDAERSALAKMADGFQHAIDGLSAVPPTVDLSGLMDTDPAVLSSVRLQFNVTNDGPNNLAVDFSTSSAARTLSISGAAGKMNVDVDTSNSTLWGSDAQRNQAIASYLKQIDNATARGHGNAALMSMFKDAFAQMNSSDGTPSQQLAGTAYAPWLAQSDHAMLTGLADFSASVTETPVSSNPFRLGEVDAFSYQLSQSTRSEGNLLKGTISQTQQSHLSASYHQALTGTGAPLLNTSKSSQSYYYMQINDDADSTTQIATEKGKLLSASLSQSSSQSTRQSEYVRGVLVSDVTTPSSSSQSKDLLALLKPLFEGGQAERNSDSWQQALTGIHSMVLLGATTN